MVVRKREGHFLWGISLWLHHNFIKQSLFYFYFLIIFVSLFLLITGDYRNQ